MWKIQTKQRQRKLWSEIWKDFQLKGASPVHETCKSSVEKHIPRTKTRRDIFRNVKNFRSAPNFVVKSSHEIALIAFSRLSWPSWNWGRLLGQWARSSCARVDVRTGWVALFSRWHPLEALTPPKLPLGSWFSSSVGLPRCVVGRSQLSGGRGVGGWIPARPVPPMEGNLHQTSLFLGANTRVHSAESFFFGILASLCKTGYQRTGVCTIEKREWCECVWFPNKSAPTMEVWLSFRAND